LNITYAKLETPYSCAGHVKDISQVTTTGTVKPLLSFSSYPTDA